MKLLAENIPAKLLRAAMPFKAGKNDVRYYLQYIHLNNKAGRIESTNAMQAFWTECEVIKSIEESILINIAKAIPAKAESVSIYEIEPIEYQSSHHCRDGLVMVKLFDWKGKHLGVESDMLCQITDYKYPDFDDRIIPDKAKIKAVSKIGLNPELFATIAKVFRALGGLRGCSSSTEFYGAGDRLVTEVVGGGATAYIATMPMVVIGGAS